MMPSHEERLRLPLGVPPRPGGIDRSGPGNMADSDAALSAATLRALLIAKSRGAVRQLLSMLPNLRPAAAFSPHKTRGVKPSSTTIRSLSMAGSVVAGALLFSGHDGALQWVRHRTPDRSSAPGSCQFRTASLLFFLRFGPGTLAKPRVR